MICKEIFERLFYVSLWLCYITLCIIKLSLKVLIHKMLRNLYLEDQGRWLVATVYNLSTMKRIRQNGVIWVTGYKFSDQLWSGFGFEIPHRNANTCMVFFRVIHTSCIEVVDFFRFTMATQKSAIYQFWTQNKTKISFKSFECVSICLKYMHLFFNRSILMTISL